MTIDLKNIKQGKDNLPPRIVIYGTGKSGKSTFASQSPNPIFADIEDGLGNLDVAKQRIHSYAELLELMTALFTQEHDYKTFVLDSADWIEPMIHDEVCAQWNAKSIEKVDGGYGKGYIYALNIWQSLLEGLTKLRNVKKMGIILIAHDKVRTYNDPTTMAYDRYTLKLQDGKNTSAVDLVKEWADCILFVKEKTLVSEEGKGKSIGRKLYTTETPAFVAGNRYNLPPELPLSWNEFEKALVQSTTNNGVK